MKLRLVGGRTWGAAALVIAALAAGACGGSVEAGGPTATAQSAATKGPVATNAQGPHIKLVGAALAEVPLRADQRAAIEQLASEADARHAATRQAREDLMNAIATQIETGKIDRAALQPKIDAAVDAWKQVRPADRAAFEKLHAILDKEQRAQFVDALVAKMHDAKGHHAWKGRLEKLAEDLKLTDDQRSQIRSLIIGQFKAAHSAHEGSWGERRAKGKAMLEAFKGDRFVMDEVMPPIDAQTKAHEMSEHILGVAEQVLPILTPEQRTTAAAKIREHSAFGEELAPAP